MATKKVLLKLMSIKRTDDVDGSADESRTSVQVQISPTPKEKHNTFHTPSTPHHNGVISKNYISDNLDRTKSPELTPLKSIKDELVMPKTIIEGEVDMRRKKYPTDKAYFIAKELLMTERTFKKDLEVINLWFRDEVSKEEDEMPDDVLNLLFALIDPIYEFHCNFLREIEQRLASWEGRSNAHFKGDHQRMGDVIYKNISALPVR
uniref:DH domain-containing protein n=1 Tax=Timema genevievae TaxID=629358 RepID=A0A7R9PKP5_TIMGE|nr:unnamed protein product [Timema genevievae]